MKDTSLCEVYFKRLNGTCLVKMFCHLSMVEFIFSSFGEHSIHPAKFCFPYVMPYRPIEVKLTQFVPNMIEEPFLVWSELVRE